MGQEVYDMAFVTIPGISGKVYVPEGVLATGKKHPCADCHSCQQCSDDRCRLCREPDSADVGCGEKLKKPGCLNR